MMLLAQSLFKVLTIISDLFWHAGSPQPRQVNSVHGSVTDITSKIANFLVLQAPVNL
jgi:hypothetical protein